MVFKHSLYKIKSYRIRYKNDEVFIPNPIFVIEENEMLKKYELVNKILINFGIIVSLLK